MKERTKGWGVVGVGLIIAAGAIYAIGMVLGLSFAVGQAADEVGGAPIGLLLVIPGLGVLGLLILVAKVIVDRLGNAEDDHYSKTVDR
ncbi:hypothetical protein GC169_07255 [bacterium]|nr:hypothetical protein [bacterium]